MTNLVAQNPTQQLEQLRRHSLQMDPNSMKIPAKNVPKRDMPTSSISAIAEDAESGSHHVHFSGSDNVQQAARPTFIPVDFASAGPAESSEAILSPTEHGTADLT